MSRNNRRRNNRIKKSSQVIRCKIHEKPVLEHEVCSSFSQKDSSKKEEKCEHCSHSF